MRKEKKLFSQGPWDWRSWAYFQTLPLISFGSSAAKYLPLNTTMLEGQKLFNSLITIYLDQFSTTHHLVYIMNHSGNSETALTC